MTHTLGLSALEMAATEAQMRGSYRSRVLLGLMDFQHRWVTPQLALSRVSGSVQVKTSPDGVTRSLGLELFDPTDILGLGSGAQAVAPNRMMSVQRGLFVDVLDRWVDFPQFLGPITKPDRADDMLTIEAQDKAAFALVHRSPFTIKAGTNIATAMQQIMATVVGETRFRIAATTRKLVRSHTLTPEYTAWQFVQKAAASLGWVVFYAADGYFEAKPRPTSPVAHFRTGVGGSLTSKVKTGYWSEEIKNRVVVTGKVVAGVAVQATATLPAAHQLSAESLKVGAVPFYKTEYVDDPDLGTTAECASAAQERLAQFAIQQTTAEFATVPFWHMQEYDAYTVEAQTGSVLASVDEMTLSFDGTPQSFGFLRSTARSRAFTVKTNSAKVRAARRRTTTRTRTT